MPIGEITLQRVLEINFNGNSNIDQLDFVKDGVRTTVWQKIIQPADLSSPNVQNGYYGSTTLLNAGAGFTSTQQILNLLQSGINNNPSGPPSISAGNRRTGRFYAGWANGNNYGDPVNPVTGAAPSGTNVNSSFGGDNWYTVYRPIIWTAGTANDPYGTKKVTFVKANTLYTGVNDEDDDQAFTRMILLGSNNTFHWCWYINTGNYRFTNGTLTPPSQGSGYYVYPNNTNKMPVVGNPSTGAIPVDTYINSIAGVGFAKIRLIADGFGESD